MSKARRRRLFVEVRLQSTLLIRAAFYWFFCLLSITMIATCWTVWAHCPQSSAELYHIVTSNLAMPFIGSLLLLPLILIDCLRLSNRFAGPMVRIHRAIAALAKGEPVEPIYLRKGDFWSDFVADLNEVIRQKDPAPTADGGSLCRKAEEVKCSCHGEDVTSTTA